ARGSSADVERAVAAAAAADFHAQNISEDTCTAGLIEDSVSVHADEGGVSVGCVCIERAAAEVVRAAGAGVVTKIEALASSVGASHLVKRSRAGETDVQIVPGMQRA